ncbi:MAG: flagellar protein FlgN [Candidatus Kapabacteria bacterium]|nr:flagellar protein FlgN [Candidatus Kapabacteria bacterium]
MDNKLITFLEYEMNHLNELLALAEKQQEALLKFDINSLENITLKQNEISKNLKLIEDQRLNYLMVKFGLTKKQAASTTMTSLEKMIDFESSEKLKFFKKTINNLLAKLNQFNSLNRVLAHRALNNVTFILSNFSNGSSFVCNVKV